MTSKPHPKMKPLVGKWLEDLTACVEDRKERIAGLENEVEQPFLVRRPPPEVLGRLHRLVRADMSPVFDKSMELLLQDTERCSELQRKEFPVNTHWIIIQKWDRKWGNLRVIGALNRFVRALENRWEEFWRSNGGEMSPYTRHWMHHRNLVDAHRTALRKEPGEKELRGFDGGFPAIGIMRRFEAGEPLTDSDCIVLSPFRPPHYLHNITPNWEKVGALLRALKNRLLLPDQTNRAIQAVAELEGDMLARYIMNEHERMLPKLRIWEREFERYLGPFFQSLGNAEYIERLRQFMPLRGAGDPSFERAARLRAQKRESKRQERLSQKSRRKLTKAPHRTGKKKEPSVRPDPWGDQWWRSVNAPKRG